MTKLGKSVEGRPVDLVYFDPPWGGPDYQQKTSKLVLFLDDKPVSAVAGLTLRNVARLVVVKTPVTVDPEELRAGIAAAAEIDPSLLSVTVHDVLKPVANAKGAVAYNLWFFRRLLESEPTTRDSPAEA